MAYYVRGALQLVVVGGVLRNWQRLEQLATEMCLELELGSQAS